MSVSTSSERNIRPQSQPAQPPTDGIYEYNYDPSPYYQMMNNGSRHSRPTTTGAPFSYINVPSNDHNQYLLHPGGGSSGTTAMSDISTITRIAAATCGNSPPQQLDDVLVLPDNMNAFTTSAANINSMYCYNNNTPAVSSHSSSTPFRLEPKFGTSTMLKSSAPNVTLQRQQQCTSNSSKCNTSGSAVRGKKRPATQSMVLNNNKSNHSGGSDSSINVNSRSNGKGGPMFQLQPSQEHQMGPPVPMSPRRVDVTLFNLQGLSIQSPQPQQQHTASSNSSIGATIGTSIYPSNSNTNNTNVNYYIATSPATTQHSTLTGGGGSSCFSKVNTSFNTPSVCGTIDCGTPSSSFRNYRSNSFGSAIDRCTQKQQAASMLGNTETISQLPLSQGVATNTIDVRLSSPRTVPLTVLTHDSVPTALASLSPAGKHYRNASMGSAASFGGSTRLPTKHQQTMDNSLLLSVHSSSSNSDECISSAGTLQTDVTTDMKSKNQIFRDDQHRAIRTPQRFTRPPLSTVQYYPDSKHSTQTIFQDSPFTSSVMTNPESPVARLPLPKVSLTPRSSRTGSITMGLPKFPCPTVDEAIQGSTGNSISKPEITRNSDLVEIERPLVPPPVRRLCETFPDSNDSKESLTLEKSYDNETETGVLKKIEKKSFFPRWSNFSSHVNVTSNVTALNSTPKKAKANNTDLMNKTMSSTPSGSASTRTSLKDVIIEFGTTDVGTINTNVLVDNTADVESLSDGEEDEFFLAIPSTLADEKRNKLDADMRQTKQPRLFHSGNPSSDGIKNQLHVTSMSSFGSTNSLLGTGFALSSTSLRGMDTSSNPNLIGMTTSNLNGRHRSSLNFSVGNSTCVNGFGMHRVNSTTSIGLDLDHVVQTTSGVNYDGCNTTNSHQLAGRDLTTPPVMAEASQPPPLSPRFGSLKSNSGDITIL